MTLGACRMMRLSPYYAAVRTQFSYPIGILLSMLSSRVADASILEKIVEAFVPCLPLFFYFYV